MPRSPYFHLIQIYFPPDQWENADCISSEECPPDWVGYPGTCIGEEGMVKCGEVVGQARSWGVFQILDVCWSPYMNPASPFTEDQWDQVMDPEVNTWMASVIWASNGWSPWTKCSDCNVCQVPGGDIPHPEGPVTTPPGYEPPVIISPEVARGGMIALGIGMMLGGIVWLERSSHRE